MANLHILQINGPEVSLVAHIAIPSANNSAGFNWRAVLVASKIGGTTILADGNGTDPGTISAAEKTLITTGQLYEVVTTWRLPTGQEAQAQSTAALDAFHAALKAATLADLQTRLAWFGFIRGSGG